MRTASIVTVAVVASALASSIASAKEVKARHAPEGSKVMRVYGIALPPYGFVQFCDREPGECSSDIENDQRYDAGRVGLKQLDDINRRVNKAIKPATDQEIYGVSEYWTLPADRGDCEDYALLKRKLLIAMGWPAGSLLMTVVRDEKGEGHAVLTARTQQGDFILDNKVEELRLWSRAPYEFIMRQSYLNPRVWMSLNPSYGVSPSALAGVRPQTR